MHAIRSSENMNENNTEERIHSHACELDLTDVKTANAATKQKAEEKSGEDDTEKKRTK